jgi:hypothetical protein
MTLGSIWFGLSPLGSHLLLDDLRGQVASDHHEEGRGVGAGLVTDGTEAAIDLTLDDDVRDWG